MPLTAKQEKALAKVPKAKRAAAKAAFNAQQATRRSRAPARPQRQQVSGHMRAQRYNPFVPGVVPVVQYEGDAVPVDVKLRHAFTSANRTVFLIGNAGHCVTMAVHIDNAATPNQGALSASQMASSATAGGPTSGRAMKIGYKLVNVSKQVDLAGRVYTLTANKRMELPNAWSALTQAEVNALADEIVAHPDTKERDINVLRSGLTVFGAPHDTTDYIDYTPWTGTENSSSFGRHFCTDPVATNELMPMTPMWIVVESTVTPNDYELTVRGSFYTRWPIDTVMSTLHRKVPTTTVSDDNLARQAAHEVGEVGMGAGLAMLGQRALPALRNAGSLFRSLGGRAVPALEEGLELAPIIGAPFGI